MDETALPQMADIPVEIALRDELAQSDAALGRIVPILGHLLANETNSLFSDEIIAQIRGMMTHSAQQFLEVEAKVADSDDIQNYIAERVEALAGKLLASPGFLVHCHALAIEWQLTERLDNHSAIDPVLTPMLQALISSDDAAVSSTAMAALTAQSRFRQQQQRMELPLTELPGELFDAMITVWRGVAGEGGEDLSGRAEAQLRANYDEGASRLGLLSRLVAGMGQGALAALSLSHAGVALFLTALAATSKQSRDIVILSCSDRQLGRLALGLRAAGLHPKEIEEQFVLIHPEVALPEGFEMLRRDRAAELLAASGQGGGLV